MPPPTGRRQRPLDRDPELAQRLDGLLGQPLAGRGDALLAGVDLHPGDAALAAVGTLHRGVEHAHRGAPDVGAGAVALDEGTIGRLGTWSVPPS
jgi:hypothetical protein